MAERSARSVSTSSTALDPKSSFGTILCFFEALLLVKWRARLCFCLGASDELSVAISVSAANCTVKNRLYRVCHRLSLRLRPTDSPKLAPLRSASETFCRTPSRADRSASRQTQWSLCPACAFAGEKYTHRTCHQWISETRERHVVQTRREWECSIETRQTSWAVEAARTSISDGVAFMRYMSSSSLLSLRSCDLGKKQNNNIQRSSWRTALDRILSVLYCYHMLASCMAKRACLLSTNS